MLRGHTNLLETAEFSPDGRRILTAAIDGTARIWDAASGKSLFVLRGHTDIVNSAKFSPDGTRVVTSSSDGTARVWSASTGATIAVLGGHVGFVSTAEFSRDGKVVATSSQDGTARLWEARTGRSLAIFPGHTDVVNGASFNPDRHARGRAERRSHGPDLPLLGLRLARRAARPRAGPARSPLSPAAAAKLNRERRQADELADEQAGGGLPGADEARTVIPEPSERRPHEGGARGACHHDVTTRPRSRSELAGQPPRCRRRCRRRARGRVETSGTSGPTRRRASARPRPAVASPGPAGEDDCARAARRPLGVPEASGADRVQLAARRAE